MQTKNKETFLPDSRKTTGKTLERTVTGEKNGRKEFMMNPMRMIDLIVWSWIFCMWSLAAQTQEDSALSQRVANYTIRARLLPEKKAVEGETRLHWRNITNEPVRELQFHLYLNAFKNEKSTFMRESGGRHRTDWNRKHPAAWGWVDILEMRLADGTDLKKNIEYIAPDDGNKDDQTVIRIPLPEPVRPGKEITMDYRFYSKLPRVFARSGYAEPDFFLVAQWYPKIGVWENGQWNCHQYHVNSEFYADFGIYDLTVSVPLNYRITANGIRLSREERDSMAVYRYVQKDVTDIVWVASPHLIEHEQTVIIPGKKQPVRIHYLLPGDKKNLIPRYEHLSQKMLIYLHDWIGEYPYSNLSIVEPPGEEGMTAGGMEYPTLITTGSLNTAWMEPWIRIHYLEIVTFHEFAHNYFQGMIATNEFEEPWLDEGFTSYAEHRMLRRYFDELGIRGDYAEIFGLAFTATDFHRVSYLSQPRRGAIIQNAWEMDRAFYQVGAYNKPVLVLRTLENYLGRTTMDRILQEYFRRWKFRHPRTNDFIAIVNEVAGKNMNWFFDRFVRSNQTVDYQVDRLRSRRVHKDAGWFDSDTGKVFVKKPVEISDADSTLLFHSSFVVTNNGDAAFPVQIRVVFENHDTLWVEWNGEAYSKTFSFLKSSPIREVWIDPDRVNWLDLNWTNNSVVAEHSTTGIWRYTTRWAFWLENIFQFFASLI